MIQMFIAFTKLMHIWTLQDGVVKDRDTVLLLLLISWIAASTEIYVRNQIV